MLTKYSPKLLALLLALLIGGGLIAAKEPAEPKQYDYVTVTQYVNNELQVTTGPHKFESINVKQEGEREKYNFTPMLNKIGELEAQGYELVENQLNPLGNSNLSLNYVLMRKLK